MQVFGWPGPVIRNAKMASRLLSPGDAAVRMRQDLVHRWRQAIRDGLTTTDAARAVNGPRATRSRWEQSPELLSRRPHRCRQGPPRAAIRQRITERRQDCPAWGRGKIAAILRRDGHPISTATVGRVIADRVARQPIAPVRAFTHDSQTTRRTRRPDAVRISGALKAQAPGDAVQVDTLTAALCPGRTVKHVTALDRHSKWGSARAATHATASRAARPSDTRVAHAPFPITALPIDGGSAFRAAMRPPARPQASHGPCGHPKGRK